MTDKECQDACIAIVERSMKEVAVMLNLLDSDDISHLDPETLALAREAVEAVERRRAASDATSDAQGEKN